MSCHPIVPGCRRSTTKNRWRFHVPSTVSVQISLEIVVIRSDRFKTQIKVRHPLSVQFARDEYSLAGEIKTLDGARKAIGRLGGESSNVLRYRCSVCSEISPGRRFFGRCWSGLKSLQLLSHSESRKQPAAHPSRGWLDGRLRSCASAPWGVCQSVAKRC